VLTFYPSWIPDPGVKKAPDPGSGSATLQKSLIMLFFLVQLSYMIVILKPKVADPDSKALSDRFAPESFELDHYLY
jgi:hypothetical protein